MDSSNGARTSCSATIQTSPQVVPAMPSWLGEVVVMAHYLARLGVLEAVKERLHFARRRFGHYEVNDFVALLIGYAISSERTLESFADIPAFCYCAGRVADFP